MEIKNLRVGNFVFKRGRNRFDELAVHEVTARDLVDGLDYLVSMTVPPSLLKKIGFKEIQEDVYVLDQFTARVARSLDVSIYFKDTHLRDGIKVHELQNIYYDLTNKEIFNDSESAIEIFNSL